jgi:hypothetical protein
MARTVGIEPTLEDLEPSVLPLNYAPIMAGAVGIEPTSEDLEPSVLPLNYAPIPLILYRV